MKASDFVKYTEFKPYKSASDTKYILLAWNGLNTEFIGYSRALNDPQKILSMARLYWYLSGMFTVLGCKFEMYRKPYQIPDYWVDFNKIQFSMYRIGININDWLNGKAFEEDKIIYHLDIIMRRFHNICTILKIKPKTLLELSVKVMPLGITEIKEPNLQYPLYASHRFAQTKHRDLYYKKARQCTSKYKDLAWLHCFEAILNDITTRSI